MADVAAPCRRIGDDGFARAEAGARVSKATREKIDGRRSMSLAMCSTSRPAACLGQTGFVAAIVPSINNSNFSDTARGITDALENRVCSCFLATPTIRWRRKRS